MSVVNRMLQDIDRRLGEDGMHAHRPHPHVRIASALGDGAAPTRPTGILVYAGFGAALIFAAWYFGHTQRLEPVRAPVATRPVAGALRVATSREKPEGESARAPAPVPATEDAPMAFKASAPSLRLSEWLAVQPAASPAPIAPPPVVAPESRPLAEIPIAPTAPAPVRFTSIAPSREVPVRRVATDETLSAARGLWNEGAHPAAIATLREALAAAESNRNAAAIVDLGRELARFEIAGNGAAAALELLKRLEPVLASDADAWALRGNAEQRLGQHHDAAASYLAALNLRPDEGKWMLGAAISLAADGRADEARMWVARARQRGPIPPAVSSYLQQLGLLPG